MKVILYYRVSTKKQDLEPQQAELRAHAAKEGWKIVAECSDVISGKKMRRDGLESALERIRSGEASALVAVKMDRFARSLVGFVELVAELGKHGAGLVCTSQGIDTATDNPQSRMLAGIMAVFAEFEREIISERTCAGLEVARAAGKTLGTPSVTLVSNWRDELAEWRTKGGSYGALGKALGVSKGTAWTLANGKLRGEERAAVSDSAKTPTTGVPISDCPKPLEDPLP